MRPRAIALAGVAAAAAAVAPLAFLGYLKLRAGGAQVFEPHAFDYALVVLSTFALVLGAQVAPWRQATYVAVLALMTGAGLLFGVLALFSIGIAVLPAALVLLVLLWGSIRRMPLRLARPAALGGALTGFGAVLMYVALAIPPTVSCTPTGGSTSSGRWGRDQAFRSSSTMNADGSQFGTIESASSVVTYRCEQGRVVVFRREAR